MSVSSPLDMPWQVILSQPTLAIPMNRLPVNSCHRVLMELCLNFAPLCAVFSKCISTAIHDLLSLFVYLL